MRYSTGILATLFWIQSSYAFAPLARHFAVQSSSTKSSLGVAGTTSAAPARATVATVPKVAQRWRKSTKQLVTLGPASSTYEMIEKLFLAGADVFRLNFSHGSQEQKKELLMTIREIEEKYSHPIGILGDLQGPKLRVSHKCGRLDNIFVCSKEMICLLFLCCFRWENFPVLTAKC
jgi:pyruvate kinase